MGMTATTTGMAMITMARAMVTVVDTIMIMDETDR
jgi:hypothetical protein